MSWKDLAEISEVVQALIAAVAAVVVYREYRAHKQARRADLAAELISQLENDELAAFAVASLDWGAGFVIPPGKWISLLDEPRPTYSARIVEEALEVGLNLSTQQSLLGQLYRRSFVQLFNRLEIMSIHYSQDPVLLEELEPLAEIAHRLWAPYYVQTDRPVAADRDLYRRALAAWYSPKVSFFLDAIRKRFPDASPNLTQLRADQSRSPSPS